MDLKRNLTVALGLTAFLFVSACTSAPKTEKEAAPLSESEKLTAIITEYTEQTKHLDAYAATYFNVEEDLDKFGDYLSAHQHNQGKKILQDALAKLKTIEVDKLPAKDQRTYRLFQDDMQDGLNVYDFPFDDLSFNQMDSRMKGYIDESSQALTMFPFDSVKHYDDFIKRSEGFPAFVDRQINALRQGVKDHVVLNCKIAENAMTTYQDALEKNVEKNPFWRPMTFMPKDFSVPDRTRLEILFRDMIATRIQPAYKKFDRFFRYEYLPQCRRSYGIGAYPHGKEWYAYAIKANTNLKLDPKVIHQMGLNEVARISGEIDQVMQELRFHGTRKEFLRSLVKNPDNFFKSPDELFAAFKKTRGEIESKLPNYFSLIPKSDFKIVASENPEQAAGSYNSPTEMIPYGRFVVNATNLKAVPKYEMTTLLMHETVPGHHFQLALAFEMKDQLSEYQRKIYNSTSFVEGWALYSEYLGREMGMYWEPMQRLGNLNDEMLRAVRLVVDTGIHSMGWTRNQAINYMVANLASDRREIEVEADRYSVWPGQALAYKIGQMKILELRKLAEKELGSKFDIKEFHKVVIGNGTVSLGVLEDQVRDWISRTK
jgi:uncharacterized protein (DUF885 family)